MAGGDVIRWHGWGVYARTEGEGDAELRRQETEIEIGDETVAGQVTDVEHGLTTRIESDDPGAVEWSKKWDRARRNLILLAKEPADPPVREPFNELEVRVPKGMRICRTCNGTTLYQDPDGFEVICANCNGTGYVPKGIEEWRHDR